MYDVLYEFKTVLCLKSVGFSVVIISVFIRQKIPILCWKHALHLKLYSCAPSKQKLNSTGK